MDRFLYMVLTMVGLLGPSIAFAENCTPWTSVTPAFLTAEVTRKNSPIRSVDDLLCRLPKSYRSNYVLVFESRSLQEGTIDAPRVILFDPEASPKVFLSFNGKPGQRGFTKIEMITESFGPQNISFTDFDFSGDRKGLPGGEVTKGPFATVSHGPLNKCLACHGDLTDRSMPPRLLFDAVPFWPNVYDSGLRTRRLISDDQVKNFKDFIAGVDRYPRYANLVGLKSKQVRNDFDTQAPFDPNRLAMSNAKLSNLAGDINLNRVVSLTKATPHYETYRYAIAAALINCADQTRTDFATYLPLEISSRLTNREFLSPVLRNDQITPQLYQQFVDQMISDSDSDKLNITNNGRAGLETLFRYLIGATNTLLRFEADTFLRSKQWNVPPGMEKVRWLLEGRKNPVDMRPWNIDSERSNYRFTNGPKFQTLQDFDDPQTLEWAIRLRESDPILKDAVTRADLEKYVSKDAQSHPEHPACEKLKTLSLQAFSKIDFDPSEPAPKKLGRKILLQKCVGCHDNGVLGAPAINFHDPKKMIHDLAWLQLPKDEVKNVIQHNPHPYMPKFDTLLPSEIEAVIQYIDSIK